jgi:hypothetical protein
MSLTERLAEIQRTLHAPKNQFNSFGKYNYRSCEDILEGVKPLLNGLVLTVSDDIIMVGDRHYVKATATVSDGESHISNMAFAREAADKKGMDASQVTGTASSYARKYALNGLFCIDDTKDADSQDNRSQAPKTAPKASKPKAVTNDDRIKAMKNAILKYCKGGEGESRKEETVRRFGNIVFGELDKKTIDTPDDMESVESAVKRAVELLKSEGVN